MLDLKKRDGIILSSLEPILQWLSDNNITENHIEWTKEQKILFELTWG